MDDEYKKLKAEPTKVEPASVSSAGRFDISISRRPRFGLWFDPRHNTQFQQFMQADRGWRELLEEFAFPYLTRGDTVLMRFPFTYWHEFPRWDNGATRMLTDTAWFDSVKDSVTSCVNLGLTPILYLPTPTVEELKTRKNYLIGFDVPTTVGLDANIGALRIPGMEKFREMLVREGNGTTGFSVMLEPGWDRYTPVDWPFPIIVASDLYQSVAAQGGANWVWPLPTDGRGPEITMMYHHVTSGDYVTGMRDWAQECKGNKWSALAPGDFFHNHNVKRSDIWE